MSSHFPFEKGWEKCYESLKTTQSLGIKTLKSFWQSWTLVFQTAKSYQLQSNFILTQYNLSSDSVLLRHFTIQINNLENYHYLSLCNIQSTYETFLNTTLKSWLSSAERCIITWLKKLTDHFWTYRWSDRLISFE